jgi:chemotaxis methyl-accepting protein methylase
VEERFLVLNEQLWGRLPRRVRDARPTRAYGAWLHGLVSRRADREMYLGTLFLRNRPALELLSRLARNKEAGSRLELAVLGCSIGAEVYSVLWTLRSEHADLDVSVHAIDISPDVLDVAVRAAYGPQSSEMVHASIFDRLTAAELQGMFDWDGDEATVKPWLREGVTWGLGDAADTELVTTLGRQDVVIANNFLCHLDTTAAESCLRNLVQLVRPGGYLFVSGVDLDVRTKVALDLGWEPVSDLRAEIHDGDPLVCADWPWQWWGLEPLDSGKPDWETRYTAVFRIG